MAIESETSKLKVVRRQKVYSDCLRAYEIFIDDRMIGSVKPNSVLEIEISSGRHIVRGKVDWGRSKPLEIYVRPGDTVEIEVANHWGAFLALWAITFGAGSYMTLKQV